MTGPQTILVLTPWLGGDYFGRLLSGVAREAFAKNYRLVVVETLAESAVRETADGRSELTEPVTWSHADGVVSITTATTVPYLARLRDTGKPIVLISAPHSDELGAPLAQPDNRGGTMAAVEHLISHGHTDIGFVGNFAQQDVSARFDAFCDVLAHHGLTVNPDHVYVAPDTSDTIEPFAARAEAAGAIAAESVLASPHRPTAIMVATDRDALGMMRALSAAGVMVPRDIALVGFDDIEAATFSSPPLTSVNQRFDEVGALATRLLLAKIGGEAVPNTAFTTDYASLIVRESCGCSVDTWHNNPQRADGVNDDPSETLVQALRAIFEDEAHTVDAESHSVKDDAIEATMREAVRLLQLGERVNAVDIQRLTASIQSLNSRPEVRRRFTEVIFDYAHRTSITTTGAAGEGLPLSDKFAAAMWKLQAGAFQREVEVSGGTIAENYVVDAGLLDTANSDPRDLQWLHGTQVKMAALGLWEGDPETGQLRIAGSYGTNAGGPDILGTIVSAEDFPPLSLLAEMKERQVCVIVPLFSRERRWGMLALVADIGSATRRENYRHWGALLCAALESQGLQESVRRSALYDALTGLPNRQLFVRELEHALALWQRAQTPFAVLFLDLDGFKLINDSLGHQMGDRVLQAVATDIQGALRSVDTAARFGGDEFVILLTDTDHDGAVFAAQRVQAAVSRTHHLDGQKIPTRASLGIATSAIDYASAEDVLRDADTAMYRAKESDPGTTVVFDAPMHASGVERGAQRIELQQAFRENQFEIHYQPIVNLATGAVDRFEALTRWRHPVRGVLLPGDFLHTMEETGLVIELGRWVISEVCRQLVEWGPEVANVSINISDTEFWSQDLLSSVTAALERYDLAPDRLTLEVTEAVLMRHPDTALRAMQKMHEAGLRLHIDDFGTGYSSLETLHRFPLDAFKIDRSFIRTLTTAERSAELISALVKLGKSLEMSVVAEGVETTEQLDFLREIGCATGQGYLFMPAITADRVMDLLSRPIDTEAARGLHS